MTVHTLRLRDVLKYNGDDFMQHYPIFDPTHRADLNQKIKDEYLMREIAHETDELFMHRFRTIMNREMPTFNEMYRIARREIDPFITMSLKTNTENESNTTRKTNTETETNSHGNVSADTESKNDVNSKTTSEAHNLGYVFPANAIEQRKDYANSGGDSDTESDVTTSNKENTTASTTSSDSGTSKGMGDETAHGNDNGLSITEGYQGLPGDLLRNYRENIMNVDAMIVSMLSRLFMGIWSTNAPLI